MVNATHSSSITENDEIIYAGPPCGFLIHSEGNKIYHAGDTGLMMDMKLLEDESIDVAFYYLLEVIIRWMLMMQLKELK